MILQWRTCVSAEFACAGHPLVVSGVRGCGGVRDVVRSMSTSWLGVQTWTPSRLNHLVHRDETHWHTFQSSSSFDEPAVETCVSADRCKSFVRALSFVAAGPEAIQETRTLIWPVRCFPCGDSIKNHQSGEIDPGGQASKIARSFRS